MNRAMKKFLAIYLGSTETAARKQWNAMPEDKRNERMRAGIAAWHRWAEEHAPRTLDMGGPLGKTKRVDASGVSDIKNALTGYVVIEAASHEDAVRLFLDHPHFAILPGESVEIMECLPVPKM
jgi:hypothetical protein